MAERRGRLCFRNDKFPNEPPFAIVGFFIKAALLEGPLHGYGIKQWIKTTTNGAIILSPATLYSRLNMEVQVGNLGRQDYPSEELSKHPLRRHLYSLTDLGRGSFEQEQEILHRVLNATHHKRVPVS